MATVEIAIAVSWREAATSSASAQNVSWSTARSTGEGNLPFALATSVCGQRRYSKATGLSSSSTVRNHVFSMVDPRRPAPTEEETGGHLSSPVPGLVIAVMAEVGYLVEKGRPSS